MLTQLIAESLNGFGTYCYYCYYIYCCAIAICCAWAGLNYCTTTLHGMWCVVNKMAVLYVLKTYCICRLIKCNYRKTKLIKIGVNLNMLTQICTYISIWLQGKSLYEEHSIFKSINVRIILSCPCNADHSLFLLWSNESHIRWYLNWNWRWSVHEKCNWAVGYWIHNFEFCIEMTLFMPVE